MRKNILIAVAAVIILALSGCSLGGTGEVYITTDTIGYSLITVKFIAPAANAGNYTNQYHTYTRTASYNGYTWYVYSVGAGTYDVYIEWNSNSDYNGRARMTLDPNSPSNEWVAVYTDTGHNVWAEEGGGTFAPGMYMYP